MFFCASVISLGMLMNGDFSNSFVIVSSSALYSSIVYAYVAAAFKFNNSSAFDSPGVGSQCVKFSIVTFLPSPIAMILLKYGAKISAASMLYLSINLRIDDFNIYFNLYKAASLYSPLPSALIGLGNEQQRELLGKFSV